MLRKLMIGAAAAASIATVVSAPALAQQWGNWGIRVFVAVYSARDGYAGLDVRRIVEARCRNSNTCAIPCNNQVFGDPIRGQFKECRVAYACGQDGNLRALVVGENATLAIDCRGPRS
jgi:hypothetical protein